MKILFHTPSGTTRPYPRSDNEPVVGLSEEYQIFDVIEQNQPTYAPSTHYIRRLPEAIDTQSKTVTRGWEIVTREVKPVVVSNYAFFRAMSREDENRLNAYVASMQDVAAKRMARIHITRAPMIHRTHPFVVQIAAILDKTDAEVDAIFAAAQILDNNS